LTMLGQGLSQLRVRRDESFFMSLGMSDVKLRMVGLEPQVPRFKVYGLGYP